MLNLTHEQKIEIIKEARKKIGVSQQGLSELMHLSKRTIQNYEQGNRIIPDYYVSYLKLLVENR